jgi:hypothetical protein
MVNNDKINKKCFYVNEKLLLIPLYFLCYNYKSKNYINAMNYLLN